jgi:hypothetical protein
MPAGTPENVRACLAHHHRGGSGETLSREIRREVQAEPAADVIPIVEASLWIGGFFSMPKHTSCPAH